MYLFIIVGRSTIVRVIVVVLLGVPENRFASSLNFFETIASMSLFVKMFFPISTLLFSRTHLGTVCPNKYDKRQYVRNAVFSKKDLFSKGEKAFVIVLTKKGNSSIKNSILKGLAFTISLVYTNSF